MDIGETIKYNVDRYDELNAEVCNRIQWAMQEGNSTRKNGTPGGLGFSVVALRSQSLGLIDIFVKEVHPGSVADR